MPMFALKPGRQFFYFPIGEVHGNGYTAPATEWAGIEAVDRETAETIFQAYFTGRRELPTRCLTAAQFERLYPGGKTPYPTLQIKPQYQHR